MQMSF